MDELIEEYGGTMIIMIFGFAIVAKTIEILNLVLTNQFLV